MKDPQSCLCGVLLIMVMLFKMLHATSRACDVGWFGEECKRLCHCAQGNCNNEGVCPSKCHANYYGLYCQMFDAMQAYGQTYNHKHLLDQDISTCVESTTSMDVRWNMSIPFVTARLEFAPDSDGMSVTAKSLFCVAPRVIESDVGIFAYRVIDITGKLYDATKDMTISFRQNGPCDQMRKVFNGHSVDINCGQNSLTLTDGFTLTFKTEVELCNIYVRLGVDVVLKEKVVNNSEDISYERRLAHVNDGDFSGGFSMDMCKLPQGCCYESIRVNNPGLAIYPSVHTRVFFVQIYNRVEYSQHISGFHVQLRYYEHGGETVLETYSSQGIAPDVSNIAFSQTTRQPLSSLTFFVPRYTFLQTCGIIAYGDLMYNAACIRSEHCQPELECDEGKCRCLKGLARRNDIANVCEYLKRPLESCSSDVECIINSTCIANKCQCKNDTHYHNKDAGLCPERLPPGRRCKTTDYCVEKPHLVCRNGRCNCEEFYYYVQRDGQCVESTRPSESCSSSIECVENSICTSGKCQCKESYYHNHDSNSCEELCSKYTWGPHCLNPCDCGGGPCNNETGECHVCEKSKWGDTCDHWCDCGGAVCQVETGQCIGHVLETKKKKYKVGETVRINTHYNPDVFGGKKVNFNVKVVDQNNAMIDGCLSASSEDEHYLSKKSRRDGYSGDSSFDVTFDKKGIYFVYVEITKDETLDTGKGQESKLTKEKDIVQSTFKVIHVEDPESLKGDEDECSWDAVAVNGEALRPFVNMTRSLQPGISAKFTLTPHDSCKGQHNLTFQWSFERIYQASTSKMGKLDYCLDPGNAKEVNLGAYLSHFIHIPLKFDLTVSSVLFQPWLLPPGNYRVSVNVTTPSHHKRFSGLFKVLENDAQSPLLPPIRIITTPVEEIFTSSVERLIINATSSYNVYALPEAGFVKEHHLRFQWSCKGDYICYSIRDRTNAGKDGMKLNNYIDLNVKESVLDIKEGYITAGSSITILLTVISEDLELGWYFKTETVKTIHFLNSPVDRLKIRCVMNCWSLVDRSRPLVLKLGYDYDMCSMFAYKDLQIRWHLLHLNRAVAQKEISHVKLRNSTYFIIHDLDDLDVEAFFVEVKVTFLKRKEGQAEQASATRRFMAPKIFNEPLQINSYLEITREMQAAASSSQGHLADKLARWDIDVAGLLTSIYQSQNNITPIIFTIRRPDYVVYRTIGGITDFIIEESKNSRLTRSVKKRIFMWLTLSTAVGSRRSFPVSYAYQKGETFTTLTDKDLADLYMFPHQLFVMGETVLGPLSKAIEDARGNKAHLKLILKILDLYASVKQEITYNNINLVLMTALRFSTVTYYDIRIVDKLLIIVKKAFSLHKVVYANEHQNTNLEIERLLFGITNGVFRYLRYVGGVLEEPDTLEVNFLKNCTMSLLLDMMKFIPDTLIWPLPMMKTVEGKGFILKCLWLEPWHFWGNISMDLNHTFFFMNVDALRSQVPENSVFQHITVVAFSSDTSLLPLTFEGLGVLSSLLIIRIENSDSKTAVRPSSNSSFYFGIKISINDVTPSKELTPANEAVVSAKHPEYLTAVKLTIMPNKIDGTIKESACLILKIHSSKDYASFIEFVSKSDYKLAVVLKLTSMLKEVISLADMKPIILPRDRPLKYLNITQGSNGIFLPAMTLRQYVNDKDASYYIMIRWLKGQKLKTNGKGKTNGMGTAMTKTVSFNCHLMVCLEWLSTRKQLQSKDCQVTSFTGGEPPYLTCSCRKGNVFTGAMAACPLSNIEHVPKSWFQVVPLEVNTFSKMNIRIFTLIIAMWMIFLAILLVVRKSYKRDEYMGMTYALPGAFCPLAEEQYLVCIVTGSRFDSGTDCTPHLVLLGEKNESSVFNLDIESHPFQPSTEIWIAVSCAYPLGKLQGVILSLDTDGYKQSWYVSQVYARNLETNEEAFFIFDQWLPNTIEPNKQFLIESASITGNEGTNIRRMFRYYRRMLMSLHMLGGLYHNIPGSKFTKAQHALYTFSSLMILMSILIPVVAKPHRQLRGDVGVRSEFESSTRHYAIAFISATVIAVLALPIGIFLDSMWTSRSGINVFWPQILKMEESCASRNLPPPPLCVHPVHSICSISSLTDSNYNATEDIPFRPSENKVTFFEGSKSSTEMRQTMHFMGSNVLSFMRRKVEGNVSDVKHRMSVMRGKAAVAIKKKRKFEILPYIVTSSLLLLVLCLSYYLGVVSLYVEEAESDAVIFIFFTASFIMCFIALPALLFFFALFLVFKPNAMRIFDMSLDADFRAVGLQEHLPTMAGLAITTQFAHPIRVDRNEGETEHELTSSLRKWHRQFCKKLLSIEEEQKVMKRMKVPEQNVKFHIVLYIVIVLVIINVQSGGVYWRYLQTQYITDRLELDQTYTSVDEALKDTDIWDYLINIVYNRTNQWFSKKDTSDLSVLTAVQLQQVRVTDYAGDCKTKRDYPQLVDLHCHWDIEDLTVDTKNFTTKWRAATDVKEVHNAFTYTPGEAEEEITAEQHTYPDGGYTVFLATWDAFDTSQTVSYLKSNSWLDNKTRAVILRMDFLNSALDYVTEVELVYEFTSIGVSKSASVYTFPLDYGVRETLILFVFATLFSLMTLYSSFNQGNKLYAEGASKFCFAYEHWIILFRDIGGIVCITMSVILIYIRQDKIKEIREIYVSHREGDSHVRLDSLAKLTSKIIMLVSLLGGSCLLQVVLRLRHYQDTKIFVNMVPQSTRAFATPAVLSVVLAMLARLWFFTTIKDFATYYESVSWLLRLLLKPNDLAMIDSHSVSGGIFIIVGPGVMFFVCLNCVLAVINDVFSELKWKVKQKHH